MDKAIIIGTYEFLGFGICHKLLHEGIEVIGVHDETINSNQFLEEKRLEIGRNANFQEVALNDLMQSSTLFSESIIYISFYDAYINRFQKRTLFNAINKWIEYSQIDKVTYSFLLPIQYLKDEEMNQFLNEIESLHLQSIRQIFYLPTIYGPWQPEVFLFHQGLKRSVIAKEKQGWHLSEREYIFDALYVEDVVTAIIKENEKRKSCSLILKSELEDSWYKCIEEIFAEHDCFLKIKNKENKQQLILEENIVKIVKQMTPITIGIRKQRELLERMMNSMI
ncbi:hypothetical protein H1Z61_04715 [Bacillus aquiflavi]|uniref:NAD(P)-dependent oxidoreductase n=1 Tax=Bacillus aquiflavi TaxID=2672567 RepID=A0A6B3VYL3_9BACI|nr:hypothetical protein [Bacillus aquiflavi]MBA4536465.1 hypothetical protein [Bacillus aquiflavi]NEY80833.1 hypothetical protein [Bacillus aquiflavi]UAC49076.1 hypothetical protein K6959_04035 [Bacillus aquiflavi]